MFEFTGFVFAVTVVNYKRDGKVKHLGSVQVKNDSEVKKFQLGKITPEQIQGFIHDEFKFTAEKG